jgi:hypothetical protein
MQLNRTCIYLRLRGTQNLHKSKISIVEEQFSFFLFKIFYVTSRIHTIHQKFLPQYFLKILI